MRDYSKEIQKLVALPWRRIMLVCAASFVLATLASFSVSFFMMPEFKGIDKVSIAGEDKLATEVQEGSATTLEAADVDKILKRNVFNSDGTLGDVEVATGGEEEEDLGKQAVETSLPIKVVGIIYGGTPFSGLATIENSSKKLINSFVVGDTILEGAKLIEIHRDRIFLDRGGRREFARLEDFILKRSSRNKKKGPAKRAPGTIAPIAKGPPPDQFEEDGLKRAGTKIEMTEAYKNKLIGEDFSKVLQDAKATPNKVGNELRGFRLTRIREDSIYLKAGLQNDDIVEEINGVPLTDVAGAISLLQSLKGETGFEIRVNRGGQTFTIEMSVN